MAVLSAITLYGRMIKVSHSVFALPFALSGAALAAAATGFRFAQLLWIIVAMMAARSAAMGFNRLADRHLDAANPRTRNRELPRGVVSTAAVTLLVVISAAALVLASYQLNALCFYLSPVALVVVFGYSYTKRFTWGSHLALGLALGLAPLGAWIAITGQFALPPVMLGFAVLVWVAGFDILYSCQDFDHDRRSGLHSVPVRFGLTGALWISRMLHLAAVAFMAWLGQALQMQAIYDVGVIAIAGFLVYEQWLVKPDDLTRVNTAFMTTNSIISVSFFAFTLADLLVLGDGLHLLSE
ncbi:MAG: UbiA-like polyprenyltransferase [Candidatus Latescibacterota bacterium]|nr:UbiA-like polyprenyltransferase [Candidatus Latescibacterota bacterium]